MSTILRTAILAFVLVCASAAYSATAYITVLKPETCGNSNGEMQAGISGSGSITPYTYLWSNGATTSAVIGVPGGSYSVTITDAVGTQYSANGILPSLSALPFDGDMNLYPSYTSFYDIMGFTGGPCGGQCNGMLSLPMVALGGTAPFSTTFSVQANYIGLDNYGLPFYGNFCAGELVNFTITDAFGCQGSGAFTVGMIDEFLLPNPFPVLGACVGSDIGSITLNQYEGFAQFSLYNGSGYVVQDTLIQSFTSVTYSGLEAGTYTVDAYPMDGQCMTSYTIEVPDLGPGCTQVQGQSWFDQDADCVFDIGEVGVPGSVMVLQPGTQYAITGWNGHYSFNLSAGNYTIEQTNTTLVPYCPASQPVPFTVNGPIADIDFANNSTAPLDLRAHIGSGWARPGFAHAIHASVANTTAQLTGAVEVTITIDPTVAIGSITPAPTSSAGNVFTWQLAELDYFGSQGFSIQTAVPVSTPLGTVLNHSISVSSANPDADLSDNMDLVTEVVVGSYDPNDKTALTSSRMSEALYFINEDEWIDYTIRFQNTGTAEALFVIITDTLPEELDMTSFQMALASHTHTCTFKPGRVVEWFFDDINLPDSTANEAESHGFVKFRIKPAQPLLAGTIIENIASIYFDFNPPVITEPSVLVAEFSTGVGESIVAELELSPVPAARQLRIAAKSTIAAVRIISPDGREMQFQRMRSNSAEIDIAHLVPGSYLLAVVFENGTVAHKRFIKQ